MCRAITYQYDCGASFHKIFPCEQRCFAGIAPQNLLQPADAAPPSANATNANGDMPATNPASTASTSAAQATAVSSDSNSTDNANSTNSNDIDGAIKPPELNTTTTNNTATTTSSSSTPTQTTSNHTSTHAHACTDDLTPNHLTSRPLAPTSTITPAHAYRIAHACYDPPPPRPRNPTLWGHVRHLLKMQKLSPHRKSSDDAAAAAAADAVIAFGSDDEVVGKMAADGRVVRVAGECPVCEDRSRREDAWAMAATFLGED